MAGFTLRNTLIKNSMSASWDADATALVFEGRSLTYAELATEVDRIAGGLSERGFAHGDRLLALLPNGVEYVELFFAVASLGGVIVPTNYLLSPHEVAHIWADSDSTWLVVHETFERGISEIDPTTLDSSRSFAVGECAGITAYEELRSDLPVDAGLQQVSADDVVLLQYTSGTSGLPKAAVHTHSTLMWNMTQQITDFALTREDVYVCVPALCWAAGFHDFTLPLFWVGGTVVLVPSQGFDPERLVSMLGEHGGTIVLLVPSVLRRVVASGFSADRPLPALRLLLSGGEALPVELIETVQALLPGVWLAQSYGMTEGPMIMSFLSDKDAIAKRGSAGQAMSATELRVVDPDDVDVPTGTVGEIICRSPGTMVGYAKAEAANELAFRGGWFHTGDSGYLDDDGYLYVVGRVKDMFITGGLNVYPAEIERVLLQHEDVAEVAVIGVPDERMGEIGRAYVVTSAASLVEDELLAFTRERMAGFKVPRQWTVMTESLPRTASGKIKKSSLRGAAAREISTIDGGR